MKTTYESLSTNYIASIDKVLKLMSYKKTGKPKSVDFLYTEMSLNDFSQAVWESKYNQNSKPALKTNLMKLIRTLDKILDDDFCLISTSESGYKRFGLNSVSKLDFESRVNKFYSNKIVREEPEFTMAKLVTRLLDYALKTESTIFSLPFLYLITKGIGFNPQSFLNKRKSPFSKLLSRYGIDIKLTGTYIKPSNSTLNTNLFFQEKLKLEIITDFDELEEINSKIKYDYLRKKDLTSSNSATMKFDTLDLKFDAEEFGF